jgi:hypothetical protein
LTFIPDGTVESSGGALVAALVLREAQSDARLLPATLAG